MTGILLHKCPWLTTIDWPVNAFVGKEARICFSTSAVLTNPGQITLDRISLFAPSLATAQSGFILKFHLGFRGDQSRSVRMTYKAILAGLSEAPLAAY